MTEKVTNCTVYSFKDSGKYYTHGRGVATEDLFINTHGARDKRTKLLDLNDGKCPGLSGQGSGFTLVVIPDDDVAYGFPVMLPKL